MEIELLKTSLQVPAKRELTLPVTGESQDLKIALNNQRIVHRAVEDLKEVLRLVMIKIGLRANNFPDKTETQVLIEHIITNYAGHTCEEIKLAFDMAIAGKLQFEKGESANCYENFSCLYFSSIMNAYRRWADEERNHLEPVKPSQKIYTDEEILNQRREQIETAFQAMKKGYYPILHYYFEDVLKEDGLLGQYELPEFVIGEKFETIADFFVRKLGEQAEHIYCKS